MKKYNFYSGPAILPQEVMEEACEGIRNFSGTGLSILEISHRSKEFVAVMEEARHLVRELMSLTGDYEVLFLQGGASTQFCMVPYNLLNENETAGYLDTGQWAHLAMDEALNFGKVHTLASSQDANYTFIPKQITEGESMKYIHVTSNNTIYGTQLTPGQMYGLRRSDSFLVADMSSDIFSRELNFNQFDLIYAGAQKNFGCAGTTLVVVNKNALGTVSRRIPRMLDYLIHIRKESMHNTPSVFAVYVSWLTLKWIKKHGLSKLEQHNQSKAGRIYEAIDESSLFEGTVSKDDRSTMNICFHLKDKSLEAKFVEYAATRGITGIKGYRTVGGFRASVYNAMGDEGVDTLIEAMKDFEKSQA